MSPAGPHSSPRQGTDAPANSGGRRRPTSQGSNGFAMPGQPQSARHHATPQQHINTALQQTQASQLSNSRGSDPAATPGGSSRATADRAYVSNTGSGGGDGSGSGSGSGGSGGDSSFSPSAARTPSSHHYGNVRPPSRFMNYAEGPLTRGPSSAVNTMDLDESLRALYFAPIPLVVLDNTRAIKMLNRPAELLFGISDSIIVGQRLEKYVTASSRPSLNVALNEASQSTLDGPSTTPYSTRLSMQPAENKAPITAELTISAWHSTDQIYGGVGSDVRGTPINLGSAPEDTNMPHSSLSPASPVDSLQYQGCVGTPTALAPHEALFTISIVPARSGTRRDSPSSTHSTMIETLKLLSFDQQENAFMAVNQDASVCAQNPACRQLLSVFKSSLAPSMQELDATKQEESDADFSWIEDAMNCFDETFQVPYSTSEWPIYRCAVLGQSTEPMRIGCEARATGERYILEVTGKPLRDNGGYGKHIGGVISICDVTQARNKMRAEVSREGDVYFKQTCDAMPQLVWVTSPTGYHEWYSKSWYDYTGSTHAESRGVGWQNFFHEEDQPEAGKRWSYSLRTGELYETAYRCKRYDGQWRWFLGRALPMRDHTTGVITRWFGTCTDIHDQVEALSASRRTQSQLESVINHAAMTMWAVDREGHITVAEGPGIRRSKALTPGTPADLIMDGGNPNASEDGLDLRSRSGSNSNTSHVRYNMVGRSIYSIWDAALIKPSIEKALEGETVIEEMELESRWFRTSFTPMRASSNEAGQLMGVDEAIEGEGKIIGVVGTSMDITDKRHAQERMEESLLEKTRALAAEGAAREASRLKSEFLANMSHEIRTPIAGVIGLSELLLDEKGLTPQQRDYAETIQRSAEGLLTVINDVLDFSKVEIGKLDVEKAPYNLEVLVRDAKRMLSFATQKKGLEFREAVHISYKGQVIGDVGRLRQVVTNLLTNAIKFTAQGYISLEVTELLQDPKSIVVRFDVRDTGCGIKKETLSRLFQPFSQADPSTARRFGGTGLGLSISKNLVELMNGTIGLESIEGEGSHAWFTIPFDKAAATPTEPISGEVSTPTSSSMPGAFGGSSEATMMGRPRKDIWILIAEDNVINAQIASKNIKKMGFSCRTAENGIKALEELGRHSYDAVLMDCQMPECDGYEATRLIRNSLNPDVRMLPVIALTASAIKGDRERALASGMVDYLAKPVKRPSLELTLCKWLYDQDARQGLARFMEPTPQLDPAATQTRVNWPEILPAMQESRLALALPTSSTPAPHAGEHLTEYPFHSSTPSTSGTPEHPSEMMTPSTTHRLAAVRLSPTSESVIERLRMPEGALKKETLSHFSRGDALSAAAVLLSARRGSLETATAVRPPLSSARSLSQGSLPRSTDGQAAVSSRKASDTQSGLSPQQKAGAPHRINLVRYNSREQGGVGRDLEGEVLRATQTGQQGLDETLDIPDEDLRMS